jgi:hypothetical protein
MEMIQRAVVFIFAVFLVCAPVQAQDARATARDLVKVAGRHRQRRVVVKMRMSMGRREMQSSDDTIGSSAPSSIREG